MAADRLTGDERAELEAFRAAAATPPTERPGIRLSQIRDPTFFAANRAAIMEAIRNGELIHEKLATRRAASGGQAITDAIRTAAGRGAAADRSELEATAGATDMDAWIRRAAGRQTRENDPK